MFSNTIKPVLETICIKRLPALRDHCSDTATLLKSTQQNLHLKTTCCKRPLSLLPFEWSLNTGYTVVIFSRIRQNFLNFNPFPNKPWFLRVCSTSLLKTLWEKEKLLVTSNFSFPTVFSTRLENFLLLSSNLKLLSANSLNLEKSKIFCLGKG